MKRILCRVIIIVLFLTNTDALTQVNTKSDFQISSMFIGYGGLIKRKEENKFVSNYFSVGFQSYKFNSSKFINLGYQINFKSNLLGESFQQSIDSPESVFVNSKGHNSTFDLGLLLTNNNYLGRNAFITFGTSIGFEFIKRNRLRGVYKPTNTLNYEYIEILISGKSIFNSYGLFSKQWIEIQFSPELDKNETLAAFIGIDFNSNFSSFNSLYSTKKNTDIEYSTDMIREKSISFGFGAHVGFSLIIH